MFEAAESLRSEFADLERTLADPATHADNARVDITPLLAAFGGHGGQGGEPGDTCAHDAMFRMTAVMAGSAEGR